MNLRAAALEYARRGYAVFPVRGKRPLTRRGFHDATTERDQIGIWWSRTPSAGVGIAAGQVSGIWVLDVDGNAGAESLRDLEQHYDALPLTPTVITPGGGTHIYFLCSEPIRCSTALLGPGLDVRGDGGYVVAPPSRHPNGGTYAWAAEAHVNDVPLAGAPGWLTDLLRARRSPATAQASGLIPAGSRNSNLASLAGAMRRHAASERAIVAGLLAENEARCNPPLPEDEVLRIARSVARYEPAVGAEPAPITVRVR